MKIIWVSSNKFGYELLKEAIKIKEIDCIITFSPTSKVKVYDSIDSHKSWYDFNIPVRC